MAERSYLGEKMVQLFGERMLRTACLMLASCLVLGCTTGFSQAGAPVKLRINTTHGMGNARGAVQDAGLSLATQVSVTTSSGEDGTPYLPPDALLADGLAHGATILSSSFSGWHYLYDSAYYRRLTDSGVVHVYAYEPRQPQPLLAPPPAAFVTVNRLGGKNGGGIEFGVAPDYMHGRGRSGTPSGVTAQVAGLMACLKYRHPSWNWFDVKAALRATASNYASGYDPTRYGYGSIDYHAANALEDSEKLPLFGPAAVVRRLPGDRLLFQVNAFRQKRRLSDVLFIFPTPPSPRLKELTLPEIGAMGGRFLFTSYLRRQSGIYAYRLSPGESAYFVWFTQDGNGKYSRIEPYSILGPFTASPGREGRRTELPPRPSRGASTL